MQGFDSPARCKLSHFNRKTMEGSIKTDEFLANHALKTDNWLSEEIYQWQENGISCFAFEVYEIGNEGLFATPNNKTDYTKALKEAQKEKTIEIDGVKVVILICPDASGWEWVIRHDAYQFFNPTIQFYGTEKVSQVIFDAAIDAAIEYCEEKGMPIPAGWEPSYSDKVLAEYGIK